MEYLVGQWFEEPVEQLVYLVRDDVVQPQKFTKKQGMPRMCRRRVAHVNVPRKILCEKEAEEKAKSEKESKNKEGDDEEEGNNDVTFDDDTTDEDVVVMACTWKGSPVEQYFIIMDCNVAWVVGNLKCHLPFGAQSSALRSLSGLIKQIQKASIASHGGAKAVATNKKAFMLKMEKTLKLKVSGSDGTLATETSKEIDHLDDEVGLIRTWLFVIVGAKGLNGGKSVMTTTPYVEVETVSTFGELTGQVATSPTKVSSTDPTWKFEALHLKASTAATLYNGLQLRVRDWDLIGDDARLGQAYLDFEDVMKRLDEESDLVLKREDDGDPETTDDKLSGRGYTFNLALESSDGSSEEDLGTLEVLVVVGDMDAKKFQPMIGENKVKVSVGESLRAKGWRPKSPVFCLPGVYGTRLDVWKGQEGWRGKSIWLSLELLGLQPSAYLQMKEIVDRSKHKAKHAKGAFSATIQAAKDLFRSASGDEEEEPAKKHSDKDRDRAAPKDGDSDDIMYRQRAWVAHMILAADGYSDPSDRIRIRPMQGINGVDYLCHEVVAKQQSIYYAYLFHSLIDIGFDTTTLFGMGYDWRIPPQKLMERDGFFLKIKFGVEESFAIHGKPVTLLAHSMGCKVVHFFLHWAEENLGYGWIEKHVFQFIAASAPWLGATKSLRTLISGDRMGLDLLVTDREMVSLSRTFGGQHWLLPLLEGDKDTWNVQNRFCFVDRGDGHEAVTAEEALKMVNASSSVEIWKEFYENEPLYCGKRGGKDTPTALLPPPVPRLRCIYGTGAKTEAQLFYKYVESTVPGIPSELRLDAHALKAKTLPSHLTFKGGIVWEQNTSDGSWTSGDGTVPYPSLALSKVWERDLASGSNGAADWKVSSILNVELPDATHLETLYDNRFLQQVTEWLCDSPELASSQGTPPSAKDVSP